MPGLPILMQLLLLIVILCLVQLPPTSADRPRRTGQAPGALGTWDSADAGDAGRSPKPSDHPLKAEADASPRAQAEGFADLAGAKHSLVARASSDDSAQLERLRAKTLEGCESGLIARALVVAMHHGTSRGVVEELQQKATKLYEEATTKMQELEKNKIDGEKKVEGMEAVEANYKDMGTKCEPKGSDGNAQADEVAACFQSAVKWWTSLKAPMENSYYKNQRFAQQDAHNQELLRAFLSYDPYTAINADLTAASQELLNKAKDMDAEIDALTVRGTPDKK